MKSLIRSVLFTLFAVPAIGFVLMLALIGAAVEFVWDEPLQQ